MLKSFKLSGQDISLDRPLDFDKTSPEWLSWLDNYVGGVAVPGTACGRGYSGF